MKVSNKNIILIALVMAFITVWVGRMIIIRMNNYLIDLDHQIAEKRLELNQVHAEIQDNSVYVRNWDNIKDFLSEPIEERQTRMNTYLQKLESESGIQITNYGSFVEKPIPDHPKFRILGYDTLRFSCSLESLVDFLARLDTDNQRLIQITRFNIDAVPGSSAPPSMAAAVPRSESELPGAKPMNLTVVMAISTPAAAPEVKAIDGREDEP